MREERETTALVSGNSILKQIPGRSKIAGVGKRTARATPAEERCNELGAQASGPQEQTQWNGRDAGEQKQAGPRLIPSPQRRICFMPWEGESGHLVGPGGTWGLPCRLFPLVLVQVGMGRRGVWLRKRGPSCGRAGEPRPQGRFCAVAASWFYRYLSANWGLEENQSPGEKGQHQTGSQDL